MHPITNLSMSQSPLYTLLLFRSKSPSNSLVYCPLYCLAPSLPGPPKKPYKGLFFCIKTFQFY